MAALLTVYNGIAELHCTWDALELMEACREIVEQPTPLMAAVIRLAAAGPPLPPPRWAEATSAVAALPMPVVAVLEADAIGPAWALALACDLRTAAEGVLVGSPEVLRGQLPGGVSRLTRLVGPAVALRLLLLGETLAAKDALELGLLHRVVPAAALGACLEELIAGFQASAPIALAYVKEAVHAGLDLSLREGLRLEADLAALLQTTTDREEGIHAFLEKRPPEFKGA
ncbi:MAG: enoyl-CoA hydratase/isomerase family protein [Chloroflexi bacterium]|nr:enoyl-CoA hydratase/isomerase family protein [Chloroflexota bacterium]